MAEWIKCSDRLPEEGKEVWVTIQGSDCICVEEGETLAEAFERVSKHRWLWSGFVTDEGWCSSDGYPMMVAPIAWMPIEKPELYKGEA